MVLSGRKIFKKEEDLKNGKTYFSREYKIIKYGKLDKKTAYRIIERTRYIYDNKKFRLEVIRMNSEKDFQYRSFEFDTLKITEQFIIDNPIVISN
jgi:hypothetical protein